MAKASQRLVPLIAIAIGACTTETVSPPIGNAAGAWHFAFSNVSGGGLKCADFSIDYVISQSGSTVTHGPLAGRLAVSCEWASTPVVLVSDSSRIIAGTIQGDVISFSTSHDKGIYGSAPIRVVATSQTGRLETSSISGGKATFSTYGVVGGDLKLNATFFASRLP